MIDRYAETQDETKLKAGANGDVLPSQIGPYRIIESLGQGGMGQVLLGESEAPRRQAAIKLMLAEGFNSEALARFRREMEVLARLEHPGIARLYEVGSITIAGAEQPWYAMEYVAGLPLDEFVKRGKLGVKDIFALVAKVAHALQFAHQKGVIHRDIKPANVLVDANGQPKILDFGIARLNEPQAQVLAQQTRFGQIIGTLAYMSPEQMSASSNADVRSDVYALGIVLYELLTGELPIKISTTSLLDAIKLLAEGKRKALSELRPNLRGEVELIVNTAVNRELNQRYDSAASFANDLENYLNHRPLKAQKPNFSYVLAKFVRRNRALAAAFTLAIASLFGATAWALIAAKSEAAARKTAERRAAEAQAAIGFINQLFYAIDPAQAQGKQPTVAEVVATVLTPEYQAPKDLSVATTVDITLAKVNSRLGRYQDAETLAARAVKSADAATDISAELKASAHLRLAIAKWEQKIAGGSEFKALSPEQLEAEFTPFLNNPALRDPNLNANDQTQAELTLAAIYQMARQLEASKEQFERTMARLSAANDQENLDEVQQQYLAVMVKWRQHSPTIMQVLQTRLAAAQRLGAKHPRVIESYSQLGQQAASRYQYSDAVRYLAAGLEVAHQIYPPDFPDFSYLNVAYAACLINNGESALAIQLLTQTLVAEKRPQIQAYVRGWLGYGQLKAGDLVSAESNLRWIVEHHPNHDTWTYLPAQQRLGLLLLHKGELAEAKKHLDEVHQRAPDAFGADSTRVGEMAIERAELMLAEGDYSRVIAALSPLIAKFRNEFGDEKVPPVKMAEAYLEAARVGLKGKS